VTDNEVNRIIQHWPFRHSNDDSAALMALTNLILTNRD